MVGLYLHVDVRAEQRDHFLFSSRRRHTRCLSDWSSDVCSSDLRDNWTQLYLYDLASGTLKNRITSGEGNVTELVRVDEHARQIWLTMQGHEPGRDPYFTYLYRVG